MKLLLTADLHLGRVTTGLPPSAESHPMETSCREAWRRIVGLAQDQKVDAVLIAGDLVEDSDAYYESLGPLVDGFQQLQNAGIQVFAVAGNHDAKAFERIAKDCKGMEGVHFVGRMGTWERVALSADGKPRLWIDGWSFPDLRHVSDPAQTYRLSERAEAGLPVVGLLHADLGAAGSSYAPTTANSLRNLPPDFWLLGHIHKPTRSESAGLATLLYPGSPQAMDFGETGWHGVWILETGGATMQLSRLQTSTVRFEDSLEIVLSPADTRETMETSLRREARRHLENLEEYERHALRCIVHRIRLVGECDREDLAESVRRNLPDFSLPSQDGVATCFSGKLADLTTLPLDLKHLSDCGGAIGHLARTLLDLESGSWKNAGWFEAVRNQVLEEYRRDPLEDDGQRSDDGRSLFAPPDEEELRALMARQARRLLLTATQESR